MKRTVNKYKYLALFVALCVLQYFFMGNITVEKDVTTNFITFLSIVFGFYITSLAIFATSKYVSNLYKLTNKEDKGLTLLHTLVYNFRVGLRINLASILYLIVIQIYFDQTTLKAIPLSDKITYFMFGIFIINFLYSYKMLNDLINVIIQEAKESSKLK